MGDVQMEELILVVGESSTDVGTEFWHTEDVVKTQLDRLEVCAHFMQFRKRLSLFEAYFDHVSRTSF